MTNLDGPLEKMHFSHSYGKPEWCHNIIHIVRGNWLGITLLKVIERSWWFPTCLIYSRSAIIPRTLACYPITSTHFRLEKVTREVVLRDCHCKVHSIPKWWPSSGNVMERNQNENEMVWCSFPSVLPPSVCIRNCNCYWLYVRPNTCFQYICGSWGLWYDEPYKTSRSACLK